MYTTKFTTLAAICFLVTCVGTMSVAKEPYVHRFGKTAFDGSNYDPLKTRIVTRIPANQPIRHDLQSYGAMTEQQLSAPGIPFGAMSAPTLGQPIVPGVSK